MNFKRALHPELVLDRKGDEVDRKIYRMVCRNIKHEGEWQEPSSDGTVRGGCVWRGPEFFINMDEFGKQHFILCKKFREGTQRVYHFGGDFLEALSKVDRDLPIDLLPDQYLAYFSFPLNTLHDGEDFVQGAYVAVGTPRYLGFGVNGIGHDTKIICASYINQTTNIIGNMLLEATPDKVSELLSRFQTRDYLYPGKPTTSPSEHNRSKRNVIYTAIINGLLYVNSMDPELMKCIPEGTLSHSKVRQRKQLGLGVTNCTVPVTLVNHQYNRPKNYNVDSTWVDTYLRIQRCGVGLTQYKFVWVREHERYYNRA